jgi:2-oxoglutarate ferredoxin oxidoreductase subunit alpha
MNPEKGNDEAVLMSGNIAAGEAALRAGCRFYAGYPITPQSELTAYMADHLPARGDTFVQAESEVAAINMLYGASAAGARVMTSSSSPGISLKQEGISYMAACELPAVIINVQRGGPGLGNIAPAQGDYYQSTRGGGHGDYRLIVFAPHTVQEMADVTYRAFDLADQYRIPAMILADGMLGQMMESVRFDHMAEPEPPEKPWALTGEPGRPRNAVFSLLLSPEELGGLNDHLQEKYRRIEQQEVRLEQDGPDEPDVLLAAFGTCARVCRQIVEEPPRELPFSVGLLRPITLWPFPTAAFSELAGRVRGILTVEMNAGQMVDDVRLAVEGDCPVEFMGRTGGRVPTATEIADRLVELFG